MLKELLALVARDGLHSQEELARELGVSEPLLEMAIQDLARMGYLKPLAEGCAHCPLRSECAIGGPARVWALTENGVRVSLHLQYPVPQGSRGMGQDPGRSGRGIMTREKEGN